MDNRRIYCSKHVKTVQQLQHKKLDLTLSEIIILVGLIRFVQLVNSEEEVQAGESSMETIEALELEEPDTP